MTDTELKYLIWLNTLPNISNRTIKNLIKKFNTAENIWKLKSYIIDKIDITENQKENLKDKSYRENLERYIEKLKENDIEVYKNTDKKYPALLKNIDDAPTIIYKKGNFDISNNKCIAIIGSRKPTYYGTEVARELARGLSRKGYTIVSGMAMGIDSFAHIGALDVGKPTITVWGTGIDNIYPSTNKDLAKKIEQNGSIITEYPLGMLPKRENFPLRNRIISGMSLGVVVVEAREKSGTIITVEYAIEQGKDVFAVPGQINNRESFGANKLIKDGAKIVTKVEDIIEEYEGINEDYKDTEQNLLIKEYDESYLTKEEKEVFSYIGTTPIQLEKILINFNKKTNNIISTLTLLEMKGYIKHLSGNYFIRK